MQRVIFDQEQDQQLEWWHRAACRGMDTDIFYQSETHSRRARMVCDSCPVRMECLQDVLEWESSDFRSGIFGGLNAGERRTLVRKNSAAKRQAAEMAGAPRG